MRPIDRGGKSGVYCPLVRIAASNVKGGRVDDGNVFLQSGGTRFISDRIERRILPLLPSLISLCSTCHATNNNLVKRTAGIPTRVWPVSILEERFLGDWKIVRKRVDSDGFESGWREDIQMSNSRRSCGILCRNGWIIISGYRCKMINLEKVLKVEESREVASFSGRIWFY